MAKGDSGEECSPNREGNEILRTMKGVVGKSLMENAIQMMSLMENVMHMMSLM